MKVVRLLVLIKGALRELVVVVNPRVVRAVQLGPNRPVDSGVVRNVFGFFALFLALFVAGAVVLSACGIDYETSFAASATCLANVGPGLGLVGPLDHFAWMPGLAKWVLVALMLIGRLEVYTVLAIVLPLTWRR
jgi:trk system potassium uptake protein TrkH